MDLLIKSRFKYSFLSIVRMAPIERNTFRILCTVQLLLLYFYFSNLFSEELIIQSGNEWAQALSYYSSSHFSFPFIFKVVWMNYLKERTTVDQEPGPTWAKLSNVNQFKIPWNS